MSNAPAKPILVTGATGFVGGALVDRLADMPGWVPMLGLRREPESSPLHLWTVLGELSSDNDWRESLRGCGAVVHAAARVHVIRETATDALAAFREVNVEGTLNLARQAADAGVRRFVFISSIKVNGEQTAPGQLFRADDQPMPQDPYGVSKYEAELALQQLAGKTGMEIVIIRPPLVYGPRVKANFLNMMRWLHKGLPLPLGSIHNKRSLVALDNLVDLISTCLDHPAAANQTFLVSDGEDLSTTQLLKRMGLALGRPARLIPVPISLLKVGAAVLCRRDMAQRLCGSLQVDMSRTRTLLGWTPPISVDEGLRRTAQGDLHEKSV